MAPVPKTSTHASNKKTRLHDSGYRSNTASARNSTDEQEQYNENVAQGNDHSQVEDHRSMEGNDHTQEDDFHTNIQFSEENIRDVDQDIHEDDQNTHDVDENIHTNDQNIDDIKQDINENGQNIHGVDQNIHENGQNIHDIDHNIHENDQINHTNDHTVQDNNNRNNIQEDDYSANVMYNDHRTCSQQSDQYDSSQENAQSANNIRDKDLSSTVITIENEKKNPPDQIENTYSSFSNPSDDFQICRRTASLEGKVQERSPFQICRRSSSLEGKVEEKPPFQICRRSSSLEEKNEWNSSAKSSRTSSSTEKFVGNNLPKTDQKLQSESVSGFHVELMPKSSCLETVSEESTEEDDVASEISAVNSTSVQRNRTGVNSKRVAECEKATLVGSHTGKNVANKQRILKNDKLCFFENEEDHFHGFITGDDSSCSYITDDNISTSSSKIKKRSRGNEGDDPPRKISLMELEAQSEQRWKMAYDSLCWQLRNTHADVGKLSLEQFKELFTKKEVLTQVFNLFDWDGTGAIKQEFFIDIVKGRTGREPGSRELSELIEVLAYVVCGENGDVTEDLLTRIFSSKAVLEKLYCLLNKDGDGANRQEIMDFIANLTYAKPRTGFTKDNLEWLEKLFRQALGPKQELSFEDFKKIVNSRNSFFAERVFQIFDRDKSGSVSLSEFLGAMQQFAGQSPNEKFKFLFRVYDLDGDGLIQQTELQQVLQACMEENGMKFSKEQIEDLTLAMFEDADTENQGEITYEALKAQLEKHNGLLENLSISIDRWLVPPKPTEKDTTFLTWIHNLWPYQLSLPYMKNNYVYLLFLLLYACVNICLFITGAVEYRESNGFTIIARACGQCLNFNCMFVLVLMLRQCITFLRTHSAGFFLPLDHHMYMHKMCGTVIFLLSVLHSLMHLINFGTILQYLTETGEVNEFSCSLAEILLTECSKKLGLVGGWANPTGIILLIILTIMVICSQPFVRKSGYFEVFYWTHLLYVVFFTLTILHAPNFWKWFVAPGVLFIIERTHRTITLRTGRGKTYISSGVLLPSKVINIVIKRPPHFHFHPGDYVFINIPTIAKYEWHPFTLSSAPEQEGALWLHIRAVGEWTSRLHAYFEEQQQKCTRAADSTHTVKITQANEAPEPRVLESVPMVAITEDASEDQGTAPSTPSTPKRRKAVINLGFESDTGELTNLPSTASAFPRAGGSGTPVGISTAPPNKKPGPQKIQSTPNFFMSKMVDKKFLDRSISVPNFYVKKSSKEERKIIPTTAPRRTTSERRFDRTALYKGQQMAGQEGILEARFLNSADRTVAQTFRYMRVKPTVITLDMPNDEDDDDDILTPADVGGDDIDSDQLQNAGTEFVKATTNSNRKKHVTVLNVEHVEKKSNGHSGAGETNDNTLAIPGSANESEAARARRKSQEKQRQNRLDSRRIRRISRLEEAEALGQCIGEPLAIYIDGPYGTASSHIFRAQHAVLIGTGIGVTPFASILQSIMHKYWKARHNCPKCQHSWTSDIPHSVMNLCKVDFFWINRDQRSFEWFVNLLSQLEIEQAEQGGVLDRFLDMHMYITSALHKTDMKAVGLQLALDLLHEKGKRDLITGLKTRTNAGRPNWDKVFKQLKSQKKGRITVFYCGPPALGRTLRFKCDEYGFRFKKENF